MRAKTLGKTNLKRNKAGFSLAELLIVVAIIGILSAFTGVAAVSMYRNMKQTQLDKTAEIIFSAVQNRLSEIYAYGNEKDVDYNHNDPVTGDAVGGGAHVTDETKDIVYISSDDDATDAYKLIMGDETISSDLERNTWVVQYQASTCRVMNVLYKDSKGLGGFGEGLDAALDLLKITAYASADGEGESADSLVALLGSESVKDAEYRKTNKFGWYGDDSGFEDYDKKVGTSAVNVEIINEENLYAHMSVTLPKDTTLLAKTKVTIAIKEATGALPATIDSTKAVAIVDGPNLQYLATGVSNDFFNGVMDDTSDKETFTYTWDFLLDTLGPGRFSGNGAGRRVNQYATVSGTAIAPGDDFYVVLKVESEDGSVPTVLDYDRDNSLFAGVASTEKKVFVEYGRHLQNLNQTKMADMNVIQIADLDFDATSSSSDIDEVNKCWKTINPDKSGDITDYKSVVLQTGAGVVTYDGQNHVIKGLDIDDGAVFSALNGTTTIKNLAFKECSAKGAASVGLFAGTIQGSAELKVENVYLESCKADGTTDVGGLFGNVKEKLNITGLTMFDVQLGSVQKGTSAGLVIGNLNAASLSIKDARIAGCSIKATTDAGGIVGNTTGAAIEIEDVKTAGLVIEDATGNRGGFIGNMTSGSTTTIKKSEVVGLTASNATATNAGGFIGNAVGTVTVEESRVCMLDAAKSGTDVFIAPPAADKKTQRLEFVKDGLTYTQLSEKAKADGSGNYFDFLDDTYRAATPWISAGSNAGGLVGVSTGNVTVTNSYAAGAIKGANAGGFVGSTTGSLVVERAYADFYIDGTIVGGFAGACGTGSTFTSCYTAGFLINPSATSAGGFTPSAVTSVSDSYSVFNFDNVKDTSKFNASIYEAPDDLTGEDVVPDINVNGLVGKYPEVENHDTYYALVGSGSASNAYYVYPYASDTLIDGTTKYEETYKRVTADELAKNLSSESGSPLLSGAFVTATEATTTPYTLSEVFVGKLTKYPFPIIQTSAATPYTLPHHNDWLTADGDKIELYTIFYDENLTTKLTDVGGFAAGYGKTGSTMAKTDSNGEFVIPVGIRRTYHGYTFVGYFDPKTATEVITDGVTEFNRSQKLDFLAGSDKKSVVTTYKAENAKNIYGFATPNQSTIFEEVPENEYRRTKRLYAVYRQSNSAYDVSVEYREFEPLDDAEKDGVEETRTLQQLYTESEYLADSEVETYQFSRREMGRTTADYPSDYNEATIRGIAVEYDKDEEVTKDYLSEQILRNNYSGSDLETRLEALYKARNDYNNSSYADAFRKAVIPEFIGYSYLDIQKLYENEVISEDYRDSMLRTSGSGYDATKSPVYSVVRIDPDAKNSDGTDKTYTYDEANGRLIPITITESTDDEQHKVGDFLLDTNKAYKYVVLYYGGPMETELVFKFQNTKTNAENEQKPVYKKQKTLQDDLKARAYKEGEIYTAYAHEDGMDDHTVQYLIQNPLDFEGYERESIKSEYEGNKRIVTMTYMRNMEFTLYFWLDKKGDQGGKYRGASTRTPETLKYGTELAEYLWEPETTGGIQGSAYTKNGYVLSYWTYYEARKNNNNEISTGAYLGEVRSGSTAVMPMTDVIAIANWTQAPTSARIEVYYQSRYDQVGLADDKKTYDFGNATTVKIGSYQGADWLYVTVSVPVWWWYEDRDIYLAPVNSIMQGQDLFGLLADDVKEGYITTTTNHVRNEEYSYRYLENKENTASRGSWRIDPDGQLVIGLYYDRQVVEYWFYYYGQNQTWNNRPQYTCTSQWQGVLDSEYYDKLSDVYSQISVTNTKGEGWTQAGDYAQICLWQAAKESDYVKASDNVFGNSYYNLGGNSRNNEYGYTRDTSKKYSHAIGIRGLYDTPFYYSDSTTGDRIPLWPQWRYQVGRNYIESGNYRRQNESYTVTQMDVFNDNESTEQYGYNEVCEWNYFPIYTTNTNVTTYRARYYMEKDNSGREYSTGYPSIDNARFNTNQPYKSVFIGSTQLNVKVGESAAIDGYTFYGYSSGYRQGSNTLPSTTVTQYTGTGTSGGYYLAGGNTAPLNLFFKRSLSRIVYGNINTAAGDARRNPTNKLYHDEIKQIPIPDKTSPYGSDFAFGGWYTTNDYSVQVTDATGKVLESYCEMASVTANAAKDGFLMPSHDLQLFARWLPANCVVDFYPLYPDIPDYGYDSRLEFTSVIKRGTKVDISNKIPLTPSGTSNSEVVREGNNYYYLVKATNGTVISKYRFEGWCEYAGFNRPRQDQLHDPSMSNQYTINDDTKLYAKWTLVEGKMTYTIYCRNYDTNQLILSVQRTGDLGDEIVINAPTSETDPVAVGDVSSTGAYSLLEGLVPIESTKPVTLTDNLSVTFYYKESSLWNYDVYNVLRVPNGDGYTNILMSTTSYQTKYIVKQLLPEELSGYAFEGYSESDGGTYGDGTFIASDQEDYIPIRRPSSTSIVKAVTMYYTLNGGVFRAQDASGYVGDSVELLTNSGANLLYHDDTYALMATYTLTPTTGDTTTIRQFVSTVDVDSPLTEAINAFNATVDDNFKALDASRYAVTISIDAAKPGDTSTTYGQVWTGTATLEVKKPYYVLTIAEGAGGELYYRIAREGVEGGWFYDKAMTMPIEANNLKDVDTTAWTDPELEKAKLAVQIVNAAITEAGFKGFYTALKSTDGQATMIIDEDGRLVNGERLTADAYAKKVTEGTTSITVNVTVIGADGTVTVREISVNIGE